MSGGLKHSKDSFLEWVSLVFQFLFHYTQCVWHHKGTNVDMFIAVLYCQYFRLFLLLSNYTHINIVLLHIWLSSCPLYMQLMTTPDVFVSDLNEINGRNIYLIVILSQINVILGFSWKYNRKFFNMTYTIDHLLFVILYNNWNDSLFYHILQRFEFYGRIPNGESLFRV